MTIKASPVRKAINKQPETRTADRLRSSLKDRDSGPQANPMDILYRVRNLAWAGQHTQAIDLITQALSNPGIILAEQMELLDLRAECYIAQGKFDLASNDAEAMVDLATANNQESQVENRKSGLNTPSKTIRAARPPLNPKLMAQALNCKANVQIRTGDLRDAIQTATMAVKIARSLRKTADQLLLAKSLFHLSEAQKNVSEYETAIESARKAIAIFQAAGDHSGAGRAYWIMAPAYNVLGNAKESRNAAQTALELCQLAGDQYGIGNAYNSLSSTDTDIVERIRHYQQAIQAFETAGYLERQASSIGNLGFAYAAFGLNIHARRLTNQALQMSRDMGAKLGMAYWLENLFDVEIRLGALDSARAHLEELARLVPDFGDPRMAASLELNYGILARAEGKTKITVRHFQSAVQAIQKAGLGNENVHLTFLGLAHLQNGNPAAALAATAKATELHRAQSFKLPDSFTSQEIWWRHAQALFAVKQTKAARESLEQAHTFLLEAIANVRDEGLRRNYLNKVDSNRELLQFWVRDGAKRKLPKERLYAHLAVETNVREPFKRLTDTALRLNALHTIVRIQTFIVEEATELSGCERLLFILEKDDQRQVADSFLPNGEDARKLLNSIDSILTQARLTRTVSLILPKKSGLSRIIAPLIAQNQTLGYIYADMDSLYGAFTETDRDMLGMLANQAAVALDNVNWAQGLEQKVRERTAELNGRIDELAIINSVQAALASQLDVSAIYELIGEQLRTMFDSQAISIVSFDLENNTRHYQYILERGYRLDIPDATIPPLSQHIIHTKQPLQINESFEMSLAAIGVKSRTLPGTKPTKSLLRVPILVGEQVCGVIGIDNIDREKAFSDTNVRLLTTLASSMSVALENARLYQEAQEARASANMASTAKSAFLANMSHELRTPLNAIIGFTRIVRRKSEGVLPVKQNENLDKILSSGEHLLGLIDSVLDIAKIEAGRVDVHAANFNISTLVDQCANSAMPLLKPAVRLEKQIGENFTMIYSDQEKIKQILLNLLSNAAKFTHEGKIVLVVEKKDSGEMHAGANVNKPVVLPVSLFPCLRISVIDNGIGISEEAVGRVFGEFQQADTSTTRQYGGTGLGLTISRNLARLLGGDLTVASELGKGSTFIFTLPIHYQPKNTQQA